MLLALVALTAVAASKPRASQRGPNTVLRSRVTAAIPSASAMSESSISRTDPNSRVSTLAPEANTSLARITGMSWSRYLLRQFWAQPRKKRWSPVRPSITGAFLPPSAAL